MARSRKSILAVETDDDFPEVIGELLAAMEFIDARMRWSNRRHAALSQLRTWAYDAQIILQMVSRRTWVIIGSGVAIYTCLYGTGAFHA